MLSTLTLLVLGTPLIIAHRGASAYRPEHTIEAYQLAIDQGADFIEPDLCITKDGILVARHENEISGTTDVAAHPEFAGRKTTKEIDGEKRTGWFTEDFTLAELKTLRAKEPFPELRPGNAQYNGKFAIPTFSEVVSLAKRQKRKVGVYAETKHPSYFRDLGLPLEPALIDVLKRYGWAGKDAPVYIQSFETNLWELNRQIDVPLIQLADSTGRPYNFVRYEDDRTYADLLKPEGLAFIKTYADGIGVAKGLVLPTSPDGTLGTPTSLAADAHKLGLKVHVWTLRPENYFLPKSLAGNPGAEVRRFVEAGVDGIFTDAPDVVLTALRPSK